MDFFDHIRAISHPNTIPPVTSKRRSMFWIQPEPKDIKVDDNFAYMTLKTFKLLTEYNSKEHNMNYIGRMFLFNGDNLLWFSADPEPNYFKNNYRKIKIIE
jgi:hypothetical protein